MSLLSGTRLASYEVLSLLGAGGMGEVYLARDLELRRDVAIKVLPASLTGDPERLSRLRREAQVLAALNHPNIGQIHGLTGEGAVRGLVLELVDGETLDERLVRARGKRLPLDEALHIARQIADGLDAAHAKGVVHRDLKPANIKITPKGTVKILDFGVATIVAADAVDAEDLSKAVTQVASEAGLVVGTPAYMSPEQARSGTVDRRTDVWAFGCVLYELVTGHPAFDGPTSTDTLAAVLSQPPDWTRIPAGTPPGVQRLLERCLRKDPAQRFRDIGDVRFLIDDFATSQTAVPPERSASLRWLWFAGAASLLIAVVLGAAVVWNQPAPELLETRLEITTPPTTDPVSIALSPDGRTIAFVATFETEPHLWIRPLDSVSAQPLAGTQSAYYPFWSPDGRSMGFFADGKLKRIDIDTGLVQTLANATAGRGGVWTGDGAILFAPQAGPVFRISAVGGERTPLETFAAPPGNGRWPQLLPDGRHLLYYAVGPPGIGGLFVGRLDQPQSRRLLDADGGAAYTAQGHVLFIRQGTMFAQQFDPERLELVGDPEPVARPVAMGEGYVPGISTSRSGLIAYRAGGGEGGGRRLAWYDRSGNELGPLPNATGSRYGPSLSPDGRTIALTRGVDGNFDVWLFDVGRGVMRRFTTDAATDHGPIWSPDGSRIVFSSNRSGQYHLYQKLSSGVGGEELLSSTPPRDLVDPRELTDQSAVAWSPDGRFLLYRTQTPRTRWDLWAWPVDGSSSAFPIAQTEADDRDGQFSPDSSWVAYESDESGRFEIYVQPFPGPGPKWLVSTNGGAQARWSPDGSDLFYIALDGQLMAVPMGFDTNRQAVEARAPVALFRPRVGAVVNVYMQQYEVSRDGEQFLVNVLSEEASTPPITIVQNWKVPGSLSAGR